MLSRVSQAKAGSLAWLHGSSLSLAENFPVIALAELCQRSGLKNRTQNLVFEKKGVMRKLGIKIGSLTYVVFLWWKMVVLGIVTITRRLS